MYNLKNFLGNKHARIASIIENEYKQMNTYINLIGSANYAFPSVLNALNTPFNLNPSEGSRGKRYFPQCNDIDELETIAEDILHSIFRCPDYYCNIEPYSGTQANQIVYQAILKPNDNVIVMSPDAGGHVSHYHYLKTFCNVFFYSVTEDENIDLIQIEKLCRQHHPKLLIAGASSYPKSIHYSQIYSICQKYDTLLLADISHTAIYVATQNHESPFGYADFVTFTTHKTTRGIRGGIVMSKAQYRSSLEHAVFPVVQGAPKFNEILAKAVMLSELASIDIKKYVEDILKISNTFTSILMNKGIKLYTNGTETHLIMVDLRKSQITGKNCEDLLFSQHILVNRNQLPNDNKPPSITSGIRIGILTLATINMLDNEYTQIAELIADTINGKCIIDESLARDIIQSYRIIE